jgi:hypothetical protein
MARTISIAIWCGNGQGYDSHGEFPHPSLVIHLIWFDPDLIPTRPLPSQWVVFFHQQTLPPEFSAAT